MLDRTRHFGRCLGDWPDGRVFEQDGKLFGADGREIEPIKAEITPADTAKKDMRLKENRGTSNQ